MSNVKHYMHPMGIYRENMAEEALKIIFLEVDLPLHNQNTIDCQINSIQHLYSMP